MSNRIFVSKASGVGMLKLNLGYRHRTRSSPSLSDKPSTPIFDVVRSQEEYERTKITEVRRTRLKFHFGTTRRSLVRMERHDEERQDREASACESLDAAGSED